MQSVGLANIVSATAEGLVATPMPLLLAPEEGKLGTLYGHMARANTQWMLKPIGGSMAIFMGTDAYVSPSWYPSKKEDRRVVPTWNYVALHVYGDIEFFDDEEKILEDVSKLTDAHERGRSQPWAVADAPDAYIRRMLQGIIGVRFPISRIEGKRKMSQNRTKPDRQGVVDGLLHSQFAPDREAAGFIPL